MINLLLLGELGVLILEGFGTMYACKMKEGGVKAC